MYFEVSLSFASHVNSVQGHVGQCWKRFCKSMAEPVPLPAFDLTVEGVLFCFAPYIFVGDPVLPLGVEYVLETSVYKGLGHITDSTLLHSLSLLEREREQERERERGREGMRGKREGWKDGQGGG